MGDVTRMDDVVSVAIWGGGRVYMEIRKCRILLPASEPVAYRLVMSIILQGIGEGTCCTLQ